MKVTIEGKRYDSKKCEEIGEIDHRNNGNYSGTTSLLRATDGKLLLMVDSNGQDLYLNDSFYEFDARDDYSIDDFNMTDDQETRAEELGLIEIV